VEVIAPTSGNTHLGSDGALPSLRLQGQNTLTPRRNANTWSSNPALDGYYLDLLATDLTALVEALRLTRLAVIGHSMGASTAAIAAATHPSMFRCVILEDLPWCSTLPANMLDVATTRTLWREDLLAMQTMDNAALLSQCRAESPGWSDEDYALWVESKKAVNPDALDILPSFVRLWPEDVRWIDCPLLIPTSEPERGALFDASTEQIVQRMRPDVQVVRIPGAMHQVRREGFVAYLNCATFFEGCCVRLARRKLTRGFQQRHDFAGIFDNSIRTNVWRERKFRTAHPNGAHTRLLCATDVFFGVIANEDGFCRANAEMFKDVEENLGAGLPNAQVA
jgi:pimeloyl-ACP methyl ester carboxylesterase